jgi:hypothetical protein
MKTRTKLAATLCGLLASASCDYGVYEGDPLGDPSTPGGSGSTGTDGGAAPNPALPPGFDHDPFFPISAGAAHAAFAGDCAACHADLAQPARFTCTTCHVGEHDEQPMDVRHLEPTGSKGVGALYAWETAACVTCHPRSDVVTQDGQLEPVIVATGKHLGKECSKCHLDRSDLARETYQAFTCGPCHDEADDKRRLLCDVAKGTPCTARELYDHWYPSSP